MSPNPLALAFHAHLALAKACAHAQGQSAPARRHFPAPSARTCARPASATQGRDIAHLKRPFGERRARLSCSCEKSKEQSLLRCARLEPSRRSAIGRTRTSTRTAVCRGSRTCRPGANPASVCFQPDSVFGRCSCGSCARSCWLATRRVRGRVKEHAEATGDTDRATG